MICKVKDEYINEIPHWIVILSNGETIYQDDRHGNSWLYLKNYVINNELKIERLCLEFRSNMVETLRNQDGYFFINKASKNFYGQESLMYIIGYLKDCVVYTESYEIPSLVLMESGSRTMENAQLGLIT